MALTQNDKVTWSDMVELYTSLRVGETKNYGSARTNIPQKQGASVKSTDFSDLQTAVSSLRSVNHLSEILSDFSSAVPAQGTLLTPTTLSTMKTQLKKAETWNFSQFSFSQFDFGFCFGAFSFTPCPQTGVIE